MARPSREQMFYQAFEEFICDHVSNIYYEIGSLTENKQKNVQNYRLTLPWTSVVGVQDLTVNGIRTEQPIYQEQWIPERTECIARFNDYFDAYSLHQNNELGPRLSYMVIRSDRSSDDDDPANANIYMITVVYHKGHKPFPHKSATGDVNDEIPRLKNVIQTLEAVKYNYQCRISNLREILGDERLRMKKMARKTSSQAYRNHARTEKHIREMFDTCKVIHDCPVCMDPIVASELVVPLCCHYICTGCASNCVICPLCRENYDQYVLDKFDKTV
jgi:hypothetical protein